MRSTSASARCTRPSASACAAPAGAPTLPGAAVTPGASFDCGTCASAEVGRTRAACSVRAVSSVRSAARRSSAVRVSSRPVACALAVRPSSRRWRAETSICSRARPRSSPGARAARVSSRGERGGVGVFGRRGGAGGVRVGRSVRARRSSSKRLRGGRGRGSSRDASMRSECMPSSETIFVPAARASQLTNRRPRRGTTVRTVGLRRQRAVCASSSARAVRRSFRTGAPRTRALKTTAGCGTLRTPNDGPCGHQARHRADQGRGRALPGAGHPRGRLHRGAARPGDDRARRRGRTRLPPARIRRGSRHRHRQAGGSAVASQG